jgi:LysR family transcriptional regulator of beta-lactamase
MQRLPDFQREHPDIDLRVLTNNNRVDLAGEGLDMAIRFGAGAWHETDAEALIAAPLGVACAPAIARRLSSPSDLSGETLLRSYRRDEWACWFAAAGVPCPAIHGPMFDSSVTMAAAAMAGHGVALLPLAMFSAALAEERLVRPFAVEIETGCYWLTKLQSRPDSAAMARFRTWLLARCAEMA